MKNQIELKQLIVHEPSNKRKTTNQVVIVLAHHIASHWLKWKPASALSLSSLLKYFVLKSRSNGRNFLSTVKIESAYTSAHNWRQRKRIECKTKADNLKSCLRVYQRNSKKKILLCIVFPSIYFDLWCSLPGCLIASWWRWLGIWQFRHFNGKLAHFRKSAISMLLSTFAAFRRAFARLDEQNFHFQKRCVTKLSVAKIYFGRLFYLLLRNYYLSRVACVFMRKIERTNGRTNERYFHIIPKYQEWTWIVERTQLSTYKIRQPAAEQITFRQLHIAFV